MVADIPSGNFSGSAGALRMVLEWQRRGAREAMIADYPFGNCSGAAGSLMEGSQVGLSCLPGSWQRVQSSSVEAG